MADKWHSERVLKRVKKVVSKRMKAAMIHLQSDVQRRISVGQPVIRSPGGSLRGTVPAQDAPTPPRVLTGRLRTSITHQVTEEGNEVVGRVGTDVPYAARLEFGFFGADRRGRNFNQAARPFLRPALRDTLPRLVALLTRPR